MLEVKSLSIEYPPHRVLEDISFSVQEGKTLAIVGKSGCGKSSLLSAIAGIPPIIATNNKAKSTVQSLRSQEKKHYRQGLGQSHVHSPLLEGSITWNGKVQSGHANYMQQDDLLLPWLRIIDNIALPLRINNRLYKISKTEARASAEDFLQHFDMQAYANYYPAQLSGGMRQRVALLRTCISITQKSNKQAALVLLDEPFARLDMITKQECQIWARTILDELKATVVLVSHDIDEALSFSDKIILLQSSSQHTPQPAKIVYQNTVSSTQASSAKTLTQYDSNRNTIKQELVHVLQKIN